MGLNAALPDRARIIENAPLPQRVEGRTRTRQIHGPWFRVRLQLPDAPESVDPGGKRRTVRHPTLLTGNKDTEGGSLTLEDGGCVISAKHQLRIVSRELGDSIWEVTGQPAVIRKKRRVLGWEIAVSQVSDEEFTPRLA